MQLQRFNERIERTKKPKNLTNNTTKSVWIIVLGNGSRTKSWENEKKKTQKTTETNQQPTAKQVNASYHLCTVSTTA